MYRNLYFAIEMHQCSDAGTSLVWRGWNNARAQWEWGGEGREWGSVCVCVCVCVCWLGLGVNITQKLPKTKKQKTYMTQQLHPSVSVNKQISKPPFYIVYL